MTRCYECGLPAPQLSNRSRCTNCEHRRAVFNERQNERLRADLNGALGKIKALEVKLAAIKAAAAQCTGHEPSLSALFKTIDDTETN